MFPSLVVHEDSCDLTQDGALKGLGVPKEGLCVTGIGRTSSVGDSVV